MTSFRLLLAIACSFVFQAQQLYAADPIDLGGVTEKHEMIPMRDGVRRSAYI